MSRGSSSGRRASARSCQSGASARSSTTTKALDPLLERLRTTIAAFRAAPASHAADLAATAGELSELLHEHIPEEEREVFPVIRTYVSAATWQRTERRMSKGVTLRHASWAHHTNRQIDGELFLSVKTVERHLARIFSKLDIAARAKLAAMVASDRH